jgi:hypothetical protein
MPSLTDKIKKAKAHRTDDPEEIDIALRWLQGEFTVPQLARALGKTRTGIYAWLPVRLLHAYRQGRLVIK